MAKNIVINGVTYNGVESLSLQTTEGEVVVYAEELQDAEDVLFDGTKGNDNYAVSGERLEGLSAETQTLSGATDGLTPAEMQEQLAAANAEVEAQAALIEEISGILDAKLGGLVAGVATH